MRSSAGSGGPAPTAPGTAPSSCARPVAGDDGSVLILSWCPSRRLAERQAGVLAAEAERVAQRKLELRRLAWSVGDVVQVALGIGLLEVQRRRQQPALQRPEDGDRLDGAGRAE